MKIDGAFIHDIDRDPVHESIARCIIDVAHSMGKRTIAEFAETGAVLHTLARLGCEHAQGNGIGMATSLGDLAFRPAGSHHGAHPASTAA